MHHLLLTPYEISSKKVNSIINLYTSNDLCFLISSYAKPFITISNSTVIIREALKFLFYFLKNHAFKN